MKLYQPDDAGYEDVSRPWKLTVSQRPRSVAVVESAEDISAALTSRNADAVGVLSTGHGVVHPADDALLINVSRLNQVTVDAGNAIAHVQGGAKWVDVLRATDPHGLAGLTGTGPHVGVTGYTLGGGVGLMLRRYGFAADSLVSAQVVLADGTIVTASESENSDLLWALKGGGGNFGVVASVDIRLYPVREIYNGGLIYPADNARELLQGWRSWAEGLPDDVTAGAMVMQFPPIPAVPEPLRGKRVVVLRATVIGNDTSRVDELRKTFGDPIIDGFQVSSYLDSLLASTEPKDPMPSAGGGGLVHDLSDETIDALLSIVEPGSPISGLDIRQSGGAAAAEPPVPSALSHREAPYIFGLQAVAPTPEAYAAVNARLATVPEALGSHLHPGALLNFMSSRTTEEQVRAAFTAEKYTKLREVKKAYDPSDAFRFGHHIPPAK